MYKKFGVSLGALLALFGFAGAASAHEVHQYEINGVPYEIVVGSLGEPVIVDDKTGVDLELVRNGQPVVGANNSLKVELIAGNKKRIEELSPVWGAEGRYKAPFIATVATTLSYRFFGELEGTPVDLTFTCNPAGHPQVEPNTERVEISKGVVRTEQEGAFGCPKEKNAFGFPEATPSELQSANMADGEASALEARIAALEGGAGNNPVAFLGVVIGILAFLGVVLLVFRGRARTPTI